MLTDPTATDRVSSAIPSQQLRQKTLRRKAVSAAVVTLVGRGWRAVRAGNDDLAEMYFLAAEAACFSGAAASRKVVANWMRQ